MSTATLVAYKRITKNTVMLYVMLPDRAWTSIGHKLLIDHLRIISIEKWTLKFLDRKLGSITYKELCLIH
jgi:hypothetical protein